MQKFETMGLNSRISHKSYLYLFGRIHKTNLQIPAHPGQITLGQVKLGQVKQGQVKSGQVRSGFLKSGQAPYSCRFGVMSD